MDFDLDEDQSALVDALQSMLRDFDDIPQSERLNYSVYNAALQDLLEQNGFLDAGRDMGPLAGALVTMELAKLPSCVEAAVSTLIAPQLFGAERPEAPFALVAQGGAAKAVRNLPIARTAIFDLGEDVAVLPVEPDAVERVESVYGYPYGRFRRAPDLSRARRLPAKGAALRHWHRVALAAEMVGAAERAIAFTIDYVKERHVFGHAVGAFQTVQHRLVQCHGIVTALRYLTLRAAWSGQVRDADLAACYGQDNVQKVLGDLHQFNGGMGVTTEHLLHFWTYRMRALQGEAGGVYAAALAISDGAWGAPDAAAAPPVALAQAHVA